VHPFDARTIQSGDLHVCGPNPAIVCTSFARQGKLAVSPCSRFVKARAGRKIG